MSSENFERFILAFYSLSDDAQARALARMEAKLADEQADEGAKAPN